MRRLVCFPFGASGTITFFVPNCYGTHFLQSRFVLTLPPDGDSTTVTANAVEVNKVGGVSGDFRPLGYNSEKISSNSALLSSESADEKLVAERCSGEAFPFKLFAEDRSAFGSKTSRVFSSSTSTSYDVAAIVEDLKTKNASHSNSDSNSACHVSTRSDIEQGFFDDKFDEGRATLASFAAASMAATVEVKKTYEQPFSSVFQQPLSQQQQNNNLPKTTPLLVTRREVASENICHDDCDEQEEAAGGEKEQQHVKEANATVDEHDKAVGGGAFLANDKDGESRVIVRDHMRRAVSVDRLACFRELADKLPRWLQNGIDRAGYVKPTFIQSVAIPLFMEKRDVVGVAPTGSGKTVAFALPALAALAASPSPARCGFGDGNDSGSDGIVAVTPCVLVLCPTRELVQQTRNVFLMLAGNAVRVKGAFGGQDRERQLDHLRRGGGCDVLVSTPGRLCDFVEVGCVRLDHIDFLIMDEADRMLELGFAPQLEFIMSNVRKHKEPRQTTMWTATWNATVGGLAARFLRAERVMLEVDREHKTNINIKQRLYALQDATQRIQAIVNLYDDGVISKQQQVLIFANRKEEVERLASELRKALRAPPDLIKSLHGGMKQSKREGILRAFKEGHVRILCATDVAARGLDVPELDHVINYDLPDDTDAYVHRIGRTGRAGRQGTAHTLIVAGDTRVPQITRFIAEQTSTALSDDVLAIIRDVELHSAATPRRLRYKSHARIAGGDWRASGNGAPALAKSSRYVRGVGRVVTLKRPIKQ